MRFRIFLSARGKVVAGSRSCSLLPREQNPVSGHGIAQLQVLTLPVTVTAYSDGILYIASPDQKNIFIPRVTSMHYSTVFICFVAVFLCIAAHRTDGRPFSEHDPGERFALAVEEEGNQLVQMLEDCDQSLDTASSIMTHADCTSLRPTILGACKNLTVLLEKLLNTHHSLAPRSMHDLDRIPIGPEKYILQQTKTTQVKIARSFVAAPRSYNIFKRKITNPDYSDDLCDFKCPKQELLEKACIANKLDSKTAEACKLCYPAANPTNIREFCKKAYKREQKVFYIACFVLIGLTLLSGIGLHVRKHYVNKRQQTQTAEDRHQTGELFHYDGANPPAAPRLDGQEGGPSQVISDQEETLDELWEEEEGDIGSSTAHKKWKQLGLLSRAGRKRIQDLFDIEATQSQSQSHHDKIHHDKIPVMPPAPNATVRQTTGSRRGRLERQLSQAEFKRMPNGTF